MLAGPIFSREALTAPRSFRHFLIRAGYMAALFVLMYTIGQATFGWQQSRDLASLARFSTLVFQVFSIIQLILVMFFGLLFTAGTIAQEKDRRTLILLLMTDMRDRELVLGKLAAGLLNVAVLIAASIPVFLLLYVLGGVTLPQILWAQAICASTALASGAWGALAAFWREKTFQTLSAGALGAILFLGVVEAAVRFIGAETPTGGWIALFNPFRALFAILTPLSQSDAVGAPVVSALGSVLAMLGLSVVLAGVAVLRLRVWNPSRFVYESARAKEDAHEKAGGEATTRNIWANPVVWREIRTRAYGRKAVLIKLAYLVLAGFTIYGLWDAAADASVLGLISLVGFAFLGLSLMSLILINAQAVTALTSERDAATLELLLMTDVTAREFIFGKLGGIFYNTKELIIAPPLVAVCLAYRGDVSIEAACFMVIGFLVLVCFAAMLGLHAGLSYDSSRTAIANSLGTMFFLFIGIFIFMMLLVEARSSFAIQIQTFLVFIVAGAMGLYASLSHKNPSGALRLAAWALPFLTFYAITQFLLAGSLGVLLPIAAAYGFATLAMLIPAVSEFDSALGRSTLDKG